MVRVRIHIVLCPFGPRQFTCLLTVNRDTCRKRPQVGGACKSKKTAREASPRWLAGRFKKSIDEVAEGIPVGELVIALGTRSTAALHDDEFDDLLLEVVVFSEPQCTSEEERRARSPSRYGYEAIGVLL